MIDDPDERATVEELATMAEQLDVEVTNMMQLQRMAILNALHADDGTQHEQLLDVLHEACRQRTRFIHELEGQVP